MSRRKNLASLNIIVWLIAATPILWMGLLVAVLVVFLALWITQVISSEAMDPALSCAVVVSLIVVVVSNAILVEMDRRQLAVRGVEITRAAGVLVLFLWPVAVPVYLFTRSKRTGTSKTAAWTWLGCMVALSIMAAAQVAGNADREKNSAGPDASNIYQV